MEERHEITTTLTSAQRKHTIAPTERRAVERERAQAERRVAEAEASLARARDVLDRCDRPLHRRRHANEFDAAKRDVARLPSVIADGRALMTQATSSLNQLDADRRDALELLRRRPSLEAKVSELDDRLDADLRRRTRIARLEQPTAIIEVLGDRPTPGAAAQVWDQAAGSLHQHQAAFDLSVGLGPRPSFFDDNAFAVSRAAVDDHVRAVASALEPRRLEIEPPGITL